MTSRQLIVIFAALALNSAGEPAHAKPILPFTSTGALGDLPTTVNSAPVSSVVFHTDDGTYTVSSSMGSQTFSGGMIESAGSASALPGPYMVYNFANITIGPSTKVTVDESSPLVLAAQTNATITGTINVTGLAGTPGGFGTGAAASLSGGGGGGAGGGAVLLLAGNQLTVGRSASLIAQGGDGGTSGDLSASAGAGGSGAPGLAGGGAGGDGGALAGGGAGGKGADGAKTGPLAFAYGGGGGGGALNGPGAVGGVRGSPPAAAFQKGGDGSSLVAGVANSGGNGGTGAGAVMVNGKPVISPVGGAGGPGGSVPGSIQGKDGKLPVDMNGMPLKFFGGGGGGGGASASDAGGKGGKGGSGGLNGGGGGGGGGDCRVAGCSAGMKGAGGTGGAGGYDGASGDNGSGPPAQKKADAGGAGGGGVVGLGAETLTLDIGGGTGPTLNVLQGLGPDSGGAGVVFFLGTPIDLLGNPVDPSADPNLLGNISLMSAGDPNEQFYMIGGGGGGGAASDGQPVPEPSTLLLFGTAFAGAVALRRRQSRTS